MLYITARAVFTAAPLTAEEEPPGVGDSSGDGVSRRVAPATVLTTAGEVLTATAAVDLTAAAAVLTAAAAVVFKIEDAAIALSVEILIAAVCADRGTHVAAAAAEETGRKSRSISSEPETKNNIER
jgi:hypothetical protein